jgi:dimethylargininase
MSSLIALTREVSPGFASCQLTHQPRVPIDVDRARAQHAAYERALADAGCSVYRIGTRVDLPDSVFVEDTAVVLDEVAVITRPGAESRRAEVADVEEAIKSHRLLARIDAPGTLDGGDVVVVGRTLFVGMSSRTDSAAIEQLRQLMAHFGYSVEAVAVRGCLHLKSAVTAIGDSALLVNREWAPCDAFDHRYEVIETDPAERGAANVLRVGDRLIAAAAYPRTSERLERLGYTVLAVDVSELAKAEGAVTCCSLVFKGDMQ